MSEEHDSDLATSGYIDCLFNNAGYQGLFAPVDDYSAEDFDKAWRLGLGNNLKHVGTPLERRY